jgi:UDP-N-acetylmuramoylalanine--D-glutamate ligase
VAVVLIGESADELQATFAAAGARGLARASDIAAAVNLAYTIAREHLVAYPGQRQATVLLSPAATSFDMFADYAARGEAFKAAVRDLAARRMEPV